MMMMMMMMMIQLILRAPALKPPLGVTCYLDVPPFNEHRSYFIGNCQARVIMFYNGIVHLCSIIPTEDWVMTFGTARMDVSAPRCTKYVNTVIKILYRCYL